MLTIFVQLVITKNFFDVAKNLTNNASPLLTLTVHNKPILTLYKTITMVEWSHAVVHSSEVGAVKKSPL